MNGVVAMNSTEKKISPDITFNVSLRKGVDGYIVAECLDLPGCVSQGTDAEEAMENLEDVIRTCCALILRGWMKKAHEEHQTVRSRPSADLEHRQEAFTLCFSRAS